MYYNGTMSTCSRNRAFSLELDVTLAYEYYTFIDSLSMNILMDH